MRSPGSISATPPRWYGTKVLDGRGVRSRGARATRTSPLRHGPATCRGSLEPAVSGRLGEDVAESEHLGALPLGELP